MAAPKLQSGRQNLIVAYLDVVLANFVTGVAANLFELPAGAVLDGGSIIVTEAFNSTSTDVLDIGDAGSANRYVNDANIHTTGIVALVPTGYLTTAPTKVTGTWVSGGGSPTTGKATIVLKYFVKGRSSFAQGLDA